MRAKWRFNKPRPGDKNREPVLGEFFATDAIKNPAEALIREAIQNALDAGLEHKMVRVRIYVSGEEGALPPEAVEAYMDGIWPHIFAPGNGLHASPTQNDSCPYLVVEDFGTTGLTGDIEQWHDKPSTKNPFYYFFRAEGQSGKGEQDRGRWGVGKTVFPRSSRASSYYGLTVRADDDKRLMMGQAILKSHYAGDTYYSPDGYYGVKLEDNLTLPIDEPEAIQKFIEAFRLKRRSESGLSVIVPWCEPEINKDSVIEAVCRDYFYPILAASLHVTVATPSSKTVIDHENILGVASGISDRLPQDFPALLELAEWATERRPQDFLSISPPPSNYAPAWSRELVSEEQIKVIQASLAQGERVAIRLPIVVRKKNDNPRKSFFDAFLARETRSESGRPVFVREGIIISDVRSPRNRGITSLVVVQDEPLATLLGDSENPAHTQWQKDSSNYKGKYFYGPSYIQFVTRSVHELLQILADEEEKSDPTLLMDLFSLPATDAIRREEWEEDDDEPSKDKTKRDFPPPSPRRFIVQKVAGGFSVSGGPQAESIPAFLDVRVAYDIRRGNPLKKYELADFDIARLSLIEEGVEVKRRGQNNLVIAVKDPRFKIAVNGFDERRDLYVKVMPKEAFDDSTD